MYTSFTHRATENVCYISSHANVNVLLLAMDMCCMRWWIPSQFPRETHCIAETPPITPQWASVGIAPIQKSKILIWMSPQFGIMSPIISDLFVRIVAYNAYPLSRYNWHAYAYAVDELIYSRHWRWSPVYLYFEIDSLVTFIFIYLYQWLLYLLQKFYHHLKSVHVSCYLEHAFAFLAVWNFSSLKTRASTK